MMRTQEVTQDQRLIQVELTNTQAFLTIDSARIHQIVAAVVNAEQISTADIAINLTDDASIRVVNARFLKHDWPTDVISFPYSEAGQSHLEGELVISAQMAIEMAHIASCDPLAELALYLVHGLLHLCGYDDQIVADQVVIRRREAEILAELGIDNPIDSIGSAPLWSGDSGRESVRWPR